MKTIKTDDFKVIGLDGGPGSGKTSGLSAVTNRTLDLGFVPIIVPESATLLIANGITPKNLGPVDFQKQIVKMQLQNESFYKKNAINIAKKLGKKPVLLCDRGILSGAAYLGDKTNLEDFQKQILGSFNLSIEDIRVRYSGIIHMVTAANGAEEFYTTANNEARTESPELARLIDEKTKEAWIGHPHLRVVPNRNQQNLQINFEQKINHVIAEILGILGCPVPLEIEDKYVLRSFNEKDIPVKYESINISQTYLLNKDPFVTERVRMRTYHHSSSYFHTIKIETNDNIGRIEIERPINESTYYRLLIRRDLHRNTILKKRYCFLWRDQYLEVDVFEGNNKGLKMLEREKTDRNDSTYLPDFLKIEKEVTNNPSYSNSMLALM
ncbi:MAG: AAA family ATPase [Minisyncoccia bacterium]